MCICMLVCELHYPPIPYNNAKYQDDRRIINSTSEKCLKFNFFTLVEVLK